MAKKKEKDSKKHANETEGTMLATASPSEVDYKDACETTIRTADNDLDALHISDELRAELRRAGLFTVNHIMELTSEEIERYGSSLMYEQYLGLIAAIRIYLRENGKEGTFPRT